MLSTCDTVKTKNAYKDKNFDFLGDILLGHLNCKIHMNSLQAIFFGVSLGIPSEDDLWILTLAS